MHKIIISVLGAKGGASKTTTAHLICHGLSKFMIRSILLTTDTEADGRISLNDKKRLYSTRSGQTDESLKSAFVKFDTLDVSQYAAALVVDGGGNRRAIDHVLSKYSDIILVPFRDCSEDLRVFHVDMNRLPTAFALPSAWPTNTFANAAANKTLDSLIAMYPGRILNPVPLCRATQEIHNEDFNGVDSTVTSIAKSLVVDVLSKLDINPYKP